MKKFNLFLISFISILLFAVQHSSAQVIWQEDFETYAGDSIIDPQSPQWNGWGNVATSALVSTDTAASGTKSLKIWDGNPNGSMSNLSDVILNLGDSTTGRYVLSFKSFIPSNDGNNGSAGSYYNLQHLIDANNNGTQWAFEVYLGPSGGSYISIKGQQYPIPEKLDEWVEITHVFDLGRDRHDFFYNGVWIVSEEFSAIANTTSAGANQMAGMDFFATCSSGCTPLGYYDDFVLSHFPDQYNDAGIVGVKTPTYCLGDSANVSVNLKNWGFNNISSATINWSIDGIAQTPIPFSGNIAPDSIENISLGKQLFSGTPPFVVKAWASVINAGTDTTTFNDTLKSFIGGAALSGNYTVNPLAPVSTTNFQSISSLVQGLNLSGVCGPTTINVASGVYNDALNLSNIAGLSAINTLTIDGGDSSKTTITQGGSYSTLTFSNVKHITVKNVTIENTGASGCAILFHEADSNTVSSSISWVDPTSTSSAINNILFSGSATGNATQANTNYNTVEHTKIIGGYYGVRMYGSATVFPLGNRIRYNQMDSVYYYGFYIYYADFVEIEGNTIDVMKRGNANAYGVYFYYIENAKVIGNDIKSLGHGLRWYNYNQYTPMVERKEIINNMIYSEGTYAMYLIYVDSVDLFHNTIYNAAMSQAAAYISANATTPITSYDIRNNIFVSEKNMAFGLYQPATVLEKFDYNIFNSGGTTLLRINANYATLAAQQAALPLWNAKSYEGDPLFISPLNLHLVGTLANDVGDTTVLVLKDIDLEVRPNPLSTIVDIGADEYEPPTCPPPVITEVTESTHTIKVKFTPKDTANDVEFQLLKCGDPLGSGISRSTTGTDSIVFANLNTSTCYTLYLREACDRGDTSIWSGPFNFQTALPIPTGVSCINGTASLLYQEDFESAPEDNGWTGNIGIGTAQGYWNVGIPGARRFGGGPSSAHSGNRWMFTEVVNRYSNDFKLISPMVDLTEVKDSAELSFWFYGHGANLGTFTVGVSTSQTGPFTQLMSWTAEGREVQTAANQPWYQVGVRLDSLVGQKVFIEFGVLPLSAGSRGQFAIDLIEVRGCVSCNTPEKLNIANKQLGEVEVAWNEKGSAASWEISYDSTKGFSPNQGTKLVTSSTAQNISGLTPGTIYYYYVRSICGSGDTSGWYGPIKKEVAYGTPFFEDFESFGSMNVETKYPWPNAWSSDATSNANAQDRWQSGRNNNGPLVDHTLGTSAGVYMFGASVMGSANDSSFFMSPDIYLDNAYDSLSISFWYHMSGATVNALEVWVDTNGVKTLVDVLVGQQQTAQADPWLERKITLDGYQGKAFKVIFKSIITTSNTSLIAIDDIAVKGEFAVSPYYPIGVLNTSNPNGVADSIGVEAWTSGTVVGVDLNAGNGLGFTLIDMASGFQEGIFIYSDSIVNNYNVVEGDSIKVLGTVAQSYGLTQFVVDSIEVISSGNAIPSPKGVFNLDETTESKFLKMEKFILLDSSQTGSYTMRAYNGSVNITINIDAQTDVSDSLSDVRNSLSAGDTICLMLGIGGQYDTSSSAPYLNGYYITPMYFSDLTICKDVTIGIDKQQSSNGGLTFYPNPTNGSFTIATSGLENDNAMITIRDISGKVIVSENIINSSSAFKKNYSLEGQAKGLYLISIIDGEKRINKKLILQ